jgi:hypothetical protein
MTALPPVSIANGKLQRAGVLSYRRGHIAIVGRPGLEAGACECYSVVKRHYSRLRSLRKALTSVSRQT